MLYIVVIFCLFCYLLESHSFLMKDRKKVDSNERGGEVKLGDKRKDKL